MVFISGMEKWFRITNFNLTNARESESYENVNQSKKDKIYEALKRNGVRADYYEVEGAVHGDDAFYEDDIVDKILDFLGSVQ